MPRDPLAPPPPWGPWPGCDSCPALPAHPCCRQLLGNRCLTTPPFLLGKPTGSKDATLLPAQGPRGPVSSRASMGQGLVQAQHWPIKQLSKGSTSSVSAPQPLQAVGTRWAHSWSFLDKSLSFQRYPETRRLGQEGWFFLGRSFWVGFLPLREGSVWATLLQGQMGLGLQDRSVNSADPLFYTKRFEDSWSCRQLWPRSWQTKLQQES